MQNFSTFEWTIVALVSIVALFSALNVLIQGTVSKFLAEIKNCVNKDNHGKRDHNDK